MSAHRFLPESLCAACCAVLLFGCGGMKPEQAAPTLLAPSELLASPMGSGVHLVWRDNSDGETEFEVERRSGTAAFAKVRSVPFDTIQHHDEAVEAGAAYAYRVRAVAGSSASGYSNEVTATAPDGGNEDQDAGVERDGGTEALPDGGYSFEQHLVPFFYRSCGAGSNSCHSRLAYGPTPSGECRGWLALEDAALGSVHPVNGSATGCPDKSLHERLVEIDSWMCESPRKKYVVPGDLQASQLYQVVAGDPTGGGSCNKAPGVPMTAMPPSAEPDVTAADIEMLRTWIEQGAPNN